MAKNIGTLVSSAIRPNNSLDPIATALANEIKGGLHSVTNLLERDNIIFERKEWGMLCYVIEQDTTYQLIYNKNSTDIMDNSNWGLFEPGSSEWLNSVLSIAFDQPLNPIDGDRYLIGVTLGDSITGIDWVNITPTSIVEWKQDLDSWQITQPTDGTSIRVDNEDNSIYRFEGSFPSGFWTKERINQVSDIVANSSDGIDYIASSPILKESYLKDMIFLVRFNQLNEETNPTININNLGPVVIKKSGISGIADLVLNDIQLGNIYTMVYDGVNFQIQNAKSDGSINVKYFIEESDYIVIPPYHQYWVYEDLRIAGTLINYGKIFIANGSLIIENSGIFSNFGQFSFLNLDLTDILDGSITYDKLNITNTSTLGYILSSNDDGSFSWVENSSISDELSNQSIFETFHSDITIGDEQATGAILTNTPKSYSTVKVFINGSLIIYGNGTKDDVVCYFSNNATDAILFEEIGIGSELYWNGNIAGYDLEKSDLIVIVYEF